MEKNRVYIGKAKSGKFDSLRINIKMSEALPFISQKNCEQFLTFFVSPTREVDFYGNTHTAYVLQDAPQMPDAPAASVAESKPAPKKRRAKKA